MGCKRNLLNIFLFAPLLLMFYFSPIFAKDADTLHKIDILQAVNDGEATLTASNWDVGNVTNCFDSDTTTLMRSANVNPAFVQINFTNQVSVSRIRVLLGEPGFPNIDKNDWWVEIADNQADLDNKSGSYRLLVPRRYDVAGEWDQIWLFTSGSAKIWKFNIERIVGDDYVHVPELELWSGEFENKFLIIVSQPLYQTGIITKELAVYQEDILKEGWFSSIITVDNDDNPKADYYCPTEKELKDVIKNCYQLGCDGFVIIGSDSDIPVAYWRYHKNRDVDNPTDLYYADVDEWIDLDGNGVYETYDSKWENDQWIEDESKPANPNNPHFYPELFFGRITAGPLCSTIEKEAEKTKFYLDKIHEYRTNGSSLTNEQLNRALFFRSDEYCPDIWDLVYGEFMPQLYCNHGILVSDPENLTEKLQEGYQFATIVTHSGNTEHALHNWTNACRKYEGFSIEDVALTNPKILYVNLFACSAAKFTLPNFGAAYLFNTDYTLTLTGSTGLWGVLLDEICGTELNVGTPVGIVIKNYINRDHGQEGWPKGVLHGDPLIKYEVNNTNKPPRITNKLNYFEASIDEEFLLNFNVTDPEHDPVIIEIESLPENAILNGFALSWTPLWRQVGNTYYFKAKAKDSYNNCYVAEFSIYVNYFKNGLLNCHDGWTKLGNSNIYLTDSSQPFKCKGTCIETNSSWGALEQNITVEPFHFYKLELWRDNEITVNNQAIYIEIYELNQKIPLGEIVSDNIRYDDYFYCSTEFYSGNNSNLTFSLHSGDENSFTSGKLYLTGLRLVDLGTSLMTLLNGDFEDGINNNPDAWTPEAFNNVANFQWEASTGKNNSHCVSIDIPSDQLDDARWIQEVQLLPNKTYKLTGWIKGENITLVQGNIGANLCLMGGFEHSPSFSGTFDWQKTELEFTTPANGIVTIGCRLGFYGSILHGKAWFDDLTLTLLDSTVQFAGNVKYDHSQKPIPNADIYVDDQAICTTNSAGQFSTSDISVGTHTVSVMKGKTEDTAISGADVLMLMKNLAFLITLNDDQKIAADVTKDGNLSGADVQAMMRYLAFFTTNTSHTGEWRFFPEDTSIYFSENTNVDFAGYLLGDVNLSWSNSPLLKKENMDEISFNLDFGAPNFLQEQQISVPLILNTFDKKMNSLLISMTFPASALKFERIEWMREIENYQQKIS